MEGTSPFEEGSQFQGEDYMEMAYQEPAAGPAWYGEAQGTEGFPAGSYQGIVMQADGYDNAQGAAEFPVGKYQETVIQTVEDGNTYGTEVYMGEADALPVAPGQVLLQGTKDQGMYQEAVFPMGEGILAQTGMLQMEESVSDAGLETLEMQVAEPQAAEFQAIQPQAVEAEATDLNTSELEVSGQETADPEMADPEIAEMETAERKITAEVETDGTEVSETEEVSDADKEDDEETRRMKHEAAEAEREAEWEEKRQAKKDAEREKLERIAEMSDDAVVASAMKQVGADTEKLTRRNMKDCVAEYIQTLCLETPEFARMVMHPRKNMIHCFRYINRKAREFIKQEMKDNDIRRENGAYGSDVPDDLCYQWAEDYFRDPDAEEDQEKEEKFVSKPYAGKAGSKAVPKKAAEKKSRTLKSTAHKPADKRTDKLGQEMDGQMYFPGQMSLSDIMVSEVKTG